MLIKRGSPIARAATFPTPKVVPPDEPALAPPSKQEVALAEMARENDILRSEIARLRQNWADELASAERRAREAAARDHVRDDAARIEMLGRTLAEARQRFGTDLIALTKRSATELSAAAMAKLFDLRADDVDLLARVVERRLADLDEQAIVELRLSPKDADGAVGTEIMARMPEGTRIVTDPALRPGTARIHLRLGAALIDPAAGFARLCAVLAEGDDDA